MYLPQTHVPPRINRREAIVAPVRPESEIPVAGTEAVLPEPVVEDIANAELLVEDDRGEIHQGDRVLLIVEDDPNYAKVLLEMARGRGFKAVVAQRGSRLDVTAKSAKVSPSAPAAKTMGRGPRSATAAS